MDYTDYQDTPPYLSPGEKQAQDDASRRVWLCLRLATTPDTWAGLMTGQQVAPTSIDQAEHARQQRAR